MGDKEGIQTRLTTSIYTVQGYARIQDVYVVGPMWNLTMEKTNPEISRSYSGLVRSRIDTLTFQPAHKIKQKQEDCDGLNLKMGLYNMKDPD